VPLSPSACWRSPPNLASGRGSKVLIRLEGAHGFCVSIFGWERQMDGVAKERDRGVRFGRKPRLVPEKMKQIRKLRAAGTTVPDIIRQTGLSKASVYRALAS
jgi:Helix-turn-helix domain of resolvase